MEAKEWHFFEKQLFFSTPFWPAEPPWPPKTSLCDTNLSSCNAQ
jgi:hypothetical protein